MMVILTAGSWVEEVIEVQRLSDRFVIVELMIGKMLVSIAAAYLPQVVLK